MNKEALTQKYEALKPYDRAIRHGDLQQAQELILKPAVYKVLTRDEYYTETLRSGVVNKL